MSKTRTRWAIAANHYEDGELARRTVNRGGRLEDLDVQRVDGVDKPAHGRGWLIAKSKGAPSFRPDRPRTRVASRQPAGQDTRDTLARETEFDRDGGPDVVRMFEGPVEPRYGLSSGHAVSGACRLEVEDVHGVSRVVAVEAGATPDVVERGARRMGKGLFASAVFAKTWNGMSGQQD